MKLDEIKKRMLDWRDFYGADISNSDDIRRARTKDGKCVATSFPYYALLLEAQHQDAMNDMDKLQKEPGAWIITDSSCDVMSWRNNILPEAVEGHAWKEASSGGSRNKPVDKYHAISPEMKK